jgi:hypothetical protein
VSVSELSSGAMRLSLISLRPDLLIRLEFSASPGGSPPAALCEMGRGNLQAHLVYVYKSEAKPKCTAWMLTGNGFVVD